MNTKKKTIISTPTNKQNKPTIKSNAFFERFEKQTIWHITLLFLLPFFVYIKTVGYLLINFDDVAIIVNNFDFLNNIQNIGTAFRTDAFIAPHGDYYRPLQTVSYMFDTLIGGGKPWLYHFSNLIYHLATVLSLYFLLRLFNIKNLTALVMALVFSVHPLLASSVSWVPARGDVLIGLFGILSFTTFIKYTDTRKIIYFIAHTLCILLAVFSKETAILFPLLLLFYFFKVAENKFNVESIKKLLPFVLFWLGIMVSFYLLRAKVVTGTPPDFIFGIKPFISNLPAIPIIICKFIFPVWLSTMPLFNTTTTLVGFVLLFITVLIILKAFKQKNWLTVMGFVWFLLFMIPPMFFKLFYSKYLLEYYEHRSYLPLIGLIIILAIWVEQFRKKHIFPLKLAALVLLIFTFLASAHSDNFRNTLAFFTNATERGNPGACTKRGEMYMESRDFPNAIKDFNLAIELSRGEYAPAFYNRGKYNSQALKDHAAAEADLSTAISLDYSYIDAYIQRASERVFSNNFEAALNDLDIAKSFDSTNVAIYYTKAKVLTSAMLFKDALPSYNKAIEMNPYIAEMYNDRAYVKFRIKDYKGALKDCNKAISLMPNLMSAYYNKGIIYLELGKPEIAIKELDSTLALTNNLYFAWFYRGIAKKQMNDMKGACEDWQESVRLGFTLAQDTINRYCR